MKLNKLFNELFSIRSLLMSFTVVCAITSGIAAAQSVEDIRWKSEDQVRAILGEPITSTPPVGTHATYTLWKYENFTVAFANNHAFHLFDKNSLRRFELDENRANSE